MLLMQCFAGTLLLLLEYELFKKEKERKKKENKRRCENVFFLPFVLLSITILQPYSIPANTFGLLYLVMCCCTVV